MILGSVSRVWFSDVPEPAPDDWTLLSGRRAIDLYVENTEIDTSHMDVGDWSEFIMGIKHARFGGELVYIEDDPGQSLLIDGAFGDASLKMKFRLGSEIGDSEYIGNVFVKELSPSTQDEDANALSIELRVLDKLELFVPAWLSNTDLDDQTDIEDEDYEIGDEHSDGIEFLIMLFGEPNA